MRFDEWIPAGPGPKPTRIQVRPPLARPTEVTSRHDAEKQEVIINLHYAEPENEKAAINEAIKFARQRGPLRYIVLIIAAEVFGTPEAYHFCKRNGFVRAICREKNPENVEAVCDMIVLEKKMK